MNTAENISNKLSYFNELDSISSVSILDDSDDHFNKSEISNFRDSRISLYIFIMIIPFILTQLAYRANAIKT